MNNEIVNNILISLRRKDVTNPRLVFANILNFEPIKVEPFSQTFVKEHVHFEGVSKWQDKWMFLVNFSLYPKFTRAKSNFCNDVSAERVSEASLNMRKLYLKGEIF